VSGGVCPLCVRRGLLLSDLAAHVEKSVAGRAGERSRDLLALSDMDLARSVSPADAPRRVRLAAERAALPTMGPRLASLGCWTCCRHQGEMPGGFEALGDAAPRALFGAGDATLLRRIDVHASVTIVGARRSTTYGRTVAREMARLLASAGIIVVSGLANGIDSAAHEGALDAGGTTLAVLGPGAERSYPRSAGKLYGRIRSSGAVVSELPPGSPTFRWMFPARNRLMAAISGVTVVVEAAERSGSLITAEMAAEGGRQVAAVPGPVTSPASSGTNRLLAEGAALVRDAQDVLDLLLGPGAIEVGAVGPPVDPDRARVLAAVEGGATTPDRVAIEAGVPFTEALVALARLEREGYVKAGAGGGYARTTLNPPVAV
jgi:DNA processing protein